MVIIAPASFTDVKSSTAASNAQTTGTLTHESSGVGDVGADLAVDLDEPLHADLLHLIPSQGVLEAIPQEDDEGQALPQLVGTGGRTRSLGRNQSGYFRSSDCVITAVS